MFAADRLDHIEAEITPLLEEGVWVISDRYYHSSVAYQSRTAGDDVDAIRWIRSINGHARKPDLTIVLDVAAPVAGARRHARGGVEIFDDAALQANLVEFYARLEEHFPNEAIVHVAAEGTVEQVAAAVLSHVEQLLEQRR
jgi:dTMP kinase